MIFSLSSLKGLIYRQFRDKDHSLIKKNWALVCIVLRNILLLRMENNDWLEEEIDEVFQEGKELEHDDLSHVTLEAKISNLQMKQAASGITLRNHPSG
jgi:hypothetical protein